MADDQDIQSLRGISKRKENSTQPLRYSQPDKPLPSSMDEHGGTETHVFPSVSQPRVADSDEFAASRKEYEFEDDDESVEGASVKGDGKGKGLLQKEKDREKKVKEKLDIEAYELRRFFLHAIVPIVLFAKDDDMTEAMLWTMAIPWVAYAAVRYVMQKSKS